MKNAVVPFIITALLFSSLLVRGGWLNGPSKKVEKIVVQFDEAELSWKGPVDSHLPPSVGFQIQPSSSKSSIAWTKRGNIIFLYSKDKTAKVVFDLKLATGVNVEILGIDVKVNHESPLNSAWSIVSRKLQWNCGSTTLKQPNTTSGRNGYQLKAQSPEMSFNLTDCPVASDLKSGSLVGKVKGVNQKNKIASVKASLRLENQTGDLRILADEGEIDSVGKIELNLMINRGRLSLDSTSGLLTGTIGESKVNLKSPSSPLKIDLSGSQAKVALEGIQNSKISLRSDYGEVKCASDLLMKWTESLRTCEGVRGDGASRIKISLTDGRIRIK